MRRRAGVVDSGLPGPKGNREFFLHLVHATGARPPGRARRLDRMPPSAEPVRRVAVVTHGKPEVIGDALARLEAIARGGRRRDRRGRDDADLVVVLGGDGTMLRALHRFLGTGVPVIGVNFGRVGFLSAMTPDAMEEGLARAFAGERRVVELPTLDVDVDGERRRSRSTTSSARRSTLGRMVELDWSVGGEDLGVLPCDGVICATPDRLDRVQPLERRPGARLGARRDGGHVRRAALAARAPARRARAASSSSSGTRRATSAVDGDRRRPRARRARRRARPATVRLGERRALLALLPGDDVLPPLPRDLCFVACGSRTSS